jgi:hypothetical protein
LILSDAASVASDKDPLNDGHAEPDLDIGPKLCRLLANPGIGILAGKLGEVDAFGRKRVDGRLNFGILLKNLHVISAARLAPIRAANWHANTLSRHPDGLGSNLPRVIAIGKTPAHLRIRRAGSRRQVDVARRVSS